MTIIEIRERVRFHLDRVASPRWGNTRLSYGIQVATDDFVQDRYDNIKNAQKKYAFETVERLRAEIRTIVLALPLIPVLDVLTLPADYRYDVGLSVVIAGITKNSRPGSISETLGSFSNSHTRPNDDYPIHNEIGNTIVVNHGQFNAFTAAILYYIRQHLIPYISEPRSSGTPLTTVTTHYVETGSIVYDTATYNAGDYFTTTAITVFTGAGTVSEIQSVELPNTSHEEIAKRTATILSGNVHNFEKFGVKEKEVEGN